MKKNAVILFLLFLSISSCKKYPDGPLISLRSRTHRLVGTWDVKSYVVDGIDSTGSLKSSPYYGLYEIKPEQNGVGIFTYKNGSSSDVGHWYFENKQEKLRITLGNSISTNINPYRGYDIIWEIRKLKEKELWLKTIYNGKEYFLKLQQ